MMDGRNLTLVGIATWAVVIFTSAGWPAAFSLRGGIWFACMFAFVICFVVATGGDCKPVIRLSLAAVQTIAAMVAMGVMAQSVKMEPVLLVIVAAQLGSLTLLPALTWIAAQTATFVFLVHSADPKMAIALSFLVFQLFAYFAVQIAHRESHARQELSEAHAELRVASGLLAISSRTEERLRIARDLHDLVGHHLTALSLNLEVASHLAQGDAKESIEKSKAIAKKLLTDVREVVSRLRENEPVDLAEALGALSEVIVAPSLHLDMSNIAVTDRAVAEVALRAVQEIVTNAVRHSGARNLWLKLAVADHTLQIDARDDGAGTDQIRFGNGLRGIRERVESAGGEMSVASTRGHGFTVHLTVPTP